jgi:hypothetical protein
MNGTTAFQAALTPLTSFYVLENTLSKRGGVLFGSFPVLLSLTVSVLGVNKRAQGTHIIVASISPSIIIISISHKLEQISIQNHY